MIATVLVLVHAAGNLLAFLGVTAAAFAVVVLLLPLRSGQGQHSSSGPGSVMAWQLIDAAAPEPQDPEPPDSRPPEPIEWPAEEYIGRHRLLPQT